MFRFFIKGGDGQPHQILLFDVIGAFYWEDSISAKMIQSALAEVADEDEILVRINCQGGAHDDGTAIYNALAAHPGKVTARIEGYACSMATAVMCAADRVEVYETALIMLHRAATTVFGNTNELLAAAEALEKADHSLATAYSRKTGKSVDEVLALIDEKRDTWLTPAEALELGLVDEVIVPKKFTALLDKAGVTALADDEGAALLVSRTLPQPVKAALEGVPGAVAVRIDGQQIEPIKAQAETPPAPAPNPPKAEAPPADDLLDPSGGDPKEGAPPVGEGDTPPAGEGDTPPAGEGDTPPAVEGDTPPAGEGDTPPDTVAQALERERARVQAIKAQARACGIPVDSPLVDNLIDEGITAELAGKQLLACKQSLQQVTDVRSSHSSGQEENRAQQVQASWDGVYKNLNRQRRN